MTKYIRSKTRLVAIIKEVFGECEISADTKALVLLLAGTLPSKDFYVWIEQIPQLQSLSSQFKEINALRFELGNFARNYIMLHAMQAVDNEVQSTELQRFITEGKAQAAWYPPKKNIHYKHKYLIFSDWRDE